MIYKSLKRGRETCKGKYKGEKFKLYWKNYYYPVKVSTHFKFFMIGQLLSALVVDNYGHTSSCCVFINWLNSCNGDDAMAMYNAT